MSVGWLFLYPSANTLLSHQTVTFVISGPLSSSAKKALMTVTSSALQTVCLPSSEPSSRWHATGALTWQ
eukprot:5744481-Karenia_brevis.AAC.1